MPLGIDDRSWASIYMPFSSPIEKGIDVTDKASMSLEFVLKYINSSQILYNLDLLINIPRARLLRNLWE